MLSGKGLSGQKVWLTNRDEDKCTEADGTQSGPKSSLLLVLLRRTKWIATSQNFFFLGQQRKHRELKHKL